MIGRPDELAEHIERPADFLIEEEIVNRKQFTRWANMLFRPHKPVDVVRADTLYFTKGVDPMLAEMPQLIRAEGKAEGKAEGMLLDKQHVLKRQLERKFGLTDEQAALIDQYRDASGLDKTLDEFVFAENAETVIKHLL